MARKCLPRLWLEKLHLQNEALICISHFQWVISPKSVVMSICFFCFFLSICFGGVGLLQECHFWWVVSLKVWWESKSACHQADTWFSSPTPGEKYFPFKWSFLNEKEFLSCASKSVFQTCPNFASCQRFLGTATLLDLFYFILILTLSTPTNVIPPGLKSRIWPTLPCEEIWRYNLIEDNPPSYFSLVSN